MRSPSPERMVESVEPNRSDLAARGDAAVMRGIMERMRERDLTVRQTPERRSFWFGHGFEIASRPTVHRLADLVKLGRKRFGAIPGVQRFVILDEHARGAYPLLDALPPGVSAQRARVLRFESSASAPSSWEAASANVADFAAISALVVADVEPANVEFQRWAVSVWQRAASGGFARFVVVREAGSIVGYAGVFDSSDSSLARFCTPVTQSAYRGRGIFSACARMLAHDALERGIHDVVICAEAESSNERLYRQLGFAPTADIDAYIATV